MPRRAEPQPAAGLDRSTSGEAPAGTAGTAGTRAHAASPTPSSAPGQLATQAHHHHHHHPTTGAAACQNGTHRAATRRNATGRNGPERNETDPDIFRTLVAWRVAALY